MDTRSLLPALMLLTVASAQTSCVGQPDGTILDGSGCHLATVCWSEQPVITECPISEGLVLDTTTGLCAPFEEAEGQCAVQRDCSDLRDGRYPLCQQECRWFYTCSGGQNLGLTYCGDGLMFSMQLQQCNWPWGVCPPCGTLDDPRCSNMEEVCDLGQMPALKVMLGSKTRA